MYPKKIKDTREWPIPKILNKLRGFVGYYYKFFKNHGQIVAPLRKLLNKEVFSWTKEETEHQKS